MDIIRQLLNDGTITEDDLEELDFDTATFSIPDLPEANDLPVKTAAQEDKKSGNVIEVKHGRASSADQMAWYEVNFETPFADGVKPTVTASVESRGTNESGGSFTPPSHDSPAITAIELLQVDITSQSLGSRSLGDRALAGVNLDDVTLSDRALSERALEQRSLTEPTLDSVSLDTQVDILDVSLPTASLPRASIPEISVGDFNVPDQQVPTTDVGAGISVDPIDSSEIGQAISDTLDSIESNRDSIQESLAENSEYTRFNEENFGDDLGIQDLDFTNLGDIRDIPSFEEELKERNRETGINISRVVNDEVDGAFSFLSWETTVVGNSIGFDFSNGIENTISDIVNFFAKELYGANEFNSNPSGEGIYESIWGAIGAELDDIKDKFLLTGGDIDDLRNKIDTAFSDYDSRLTGSQGALQTFVEDLLTDLRNTFGNFDTGINQIAQLTDTELSSMASTIDSNFSNARESINTRVQNLQQQVNTRLEDVNQIQENVQVAVDDLNSNINGALSDLNADIESSINELVGTIQTAVNDQATEVETQFNALSEQTQAQVNDLRDNIESTMLNNNEITRDAINTLTDNVRAEIQSMNTNIESALQDIVSEADTEFKDFRTDVLGQMQTMTDEVRNNNSVIESTIQDMNADIETNIQDMNTDVESTIQNMNSDVDTSISQLASDVDSNMKQLADDTESQINAVSDDIEQKLNQFNQNVNASYESLAGLAEEALNRSSQEVFQKIGAPDGEGIAPVHIRNVGPNGFEFLGYQGGMTIHWNAIGAAQEGEGDDIIGGGGGGVGGLPEPPEGFPGLIIRQ